MATSLMSSVNIPFISSSISTETCQNREQIGTGYGLSKTSFLGGNTKKLFSSQSKRVLRFRKFKSLIAASSFNRFPKQFREENLKEGLMENYKNVPEQLYGLSPSQMNMFATKYSPIFRQSAKLKEESLSSTRSYADICGGLWSMSGMKDGGQSSMNDSIDNLYCRSDDYRSMRDPGEPPDLPSALLDSRIVYLGLPIVPEVAELINAQLIYLNFVDPREPVSLYINCLGTKNEQSQNVSDPVNAYSVAECMNILFPNKVYTVNLGTAYGQAAMLLSRGAKGKRFLQPHSSVRLYMPSRDRTYGQTTDIYIEAKDALLTNDNFLELLSGGIGKPAEVIREDIRLSKYFNPQQAIDYGIADQLVPERALYGGTTLPLKKDRKPKERKPRDRRGGAEAAPSGS